MNKIIMSLLVCLALIPIVSAVNVTLYDHTSQCLVDCYTTYNVTADDQSIVLDSSTYYFEFRDKNDMTLRTDDKVVWMKGYGVDYQITETFKESQTTCDEIQEQMVKGELNDVCVDEKTLNYTRTVTSWKPMPTSLSLSKGESVLMRLHLTKSTLIQDTRVDNVLVIKDALSERANPQGFVKFTEYAWFDTDWKNRKNISIVEPATLQWNDHVFPYKQLCYNVTGIDLSSGSANEIRVIDGDNDLELPRDIISSDDSTWACIAVGAVNVSSGATKILSVYYNNSGAAAPTQNDRVSVSTTGDDTIDGVGIYGYQDAILDMDSGIVSNFEPDNSTDIIDLYTGRVREAGVTVFFGDADDTCTQKFDGVVHSTYCCEASEDSDSDGNCESGETQNIWWFRPNAIYVNATKDDGAGGWDISNDYNTAVDGDWYYDSTSASGSVTVTVANGYNANDWTINSDVFNVFDEDLATSGDSVHMKGGGSEEQMFLASTFGYNDAISSLMAIESNGTVGTSKLNSEGQNWEKRYDTPLEGGATLGSEEDVPSSNTDPTMTLVTPINNTIIGVDQGNLSVLFEDDDLDTMTIEIKANGTERYTQSSVSNGTTLTFNLSTLSQGDVIQWNATVDDGTTNVTDVPGNWTFTVNTDPTVTLQSPTDNLKINDLFANLTVNFTDADTSQTFNITIEANGSIVYTQNNVAHNEELVYNMTGLTAGETIQWRATSHDGFVNTTATNFTFTVNSDPVVTLDSPADAATITDLFANLTVTFTDADTPTDVMNITIEANGSIVYTQNAVSSGSQLVYNLTGLSDMETIQWRATASDGTTNTTSSNFSFMVVTPAEGGGGGGGGTSVLGSINLATNASFSMRNKKTCLAFSSLPTCSLDIMSNKPFREFSSTDFEVERKSDQLLNFLEVTLIGMPNKFRQVKNGTVLIDGVEQEIELGIINFKTLPVLIGAIVLLLSLILSTTAGGRNE